MDKSRKQFIEDFGATCRNWIYSWSFVNHRDKQVIFSVHENYAKSETPLIFTNDWKFNKFGLPNSAFEQSKEHIRLIEEQGYYLFILSMQTDVSGYTLLTNNRYLPQLMPKELVRDGNNWLAKTKKVIV